MAFIKSQKIVRDESGNITSGSAAIVDTKYGDFGSYHAKHTVREKLGKVIWLSSDKKSGIFLSPTRGLVEYNAQTDTFSSVGKDDSRLKRADIFPDTQIHTVFGDTFLLLEFLKKARLLSALRSVFPKNQDYERVLCHVLHGVLKDGSKISCDNFIEKSFASYVLDDIPESTLRCDTRFFSLMGEDDTRMAFFRNFVKVMQDSDPAFGKACYVDSTPLPNDIEDNPFNALSCHGVSASDVMVRLVLVLDEATGLPVWYDIIPGNVLDINTIMNVVNDVADSLGIVIDSLVLDAGYVSKDLVSAFHIGTEKTLIGRMPARKGYPYKELYWEVKPIIGKGKYSFVRKHHVYFGHRKDITLFDQKEYAYVYVDQYNALKKYSDYLVNHPDEFEAMKDRDKDWLTVKFGYFVLVSNIDTTPEKLLTDYFGRCEIETVFKTSKEYLELLPISKWTDLTVRGKILHDIIDTIVVLLLRKEMDNSGISTSELYGKTQSLMCFRNSAGMVTVETPSKQVKQYYNLIHTDVPAHVEVASFKKGILDAAM
ncbi:MAG: transposase [Solobacterium sp.]|jgi:hypothetical protein|nr:transposase [Solobacterium sp.]MCH4013419.1 transposase [Solobacterium sp.]MCH4014342.1 transposase [Solobacterium sp.]MCH4014618.1 transposase [Solobacterium sp.]MCH4014624.1 transposase [Solobacterium sp.]